MGLRYCKLTLLHCCVQETSSGTAKLYAAQITPHILKPSSKKQMDFKYVAYKFIQKKLELCCSKLRSRSHTIYLVAKNDDQFVNRKHVG